MVHSEEDKIELRQWVVDDEFEEMERLAVWSGSDDGWGIEKQ